MYVVGAGDACLEEPGVTNRGRPRYMFEWQG